MNDNEREMWVMNDEYLYRMWQSWMKTNKGGKRGFIRCHRKLIDRYIEQRPWESES